MIQRIQTVWLLVAGLLAVGTFELSFYKADMKDSTTVLLYAHTSTILVYMAAAVLALICFGTIFLFKNRPLQSRLCLLGIVLSIGLLILEDHQVDVTEALSNYSTGAWRPGIALPILVIVALILAMRGIRKDRKLVKSLERLR
ncbi:MAG TPA: DUF4293 domain-containing protein [Dinghuibacter sp.]|uniref:DUF4293 domain-containing protein n=1 Tax=Dinghuibacter sp. TaxID=2024697 RepID=UPI002D07C069|nr:DUF4293 domain-containing protein [Dinghuibacter sp.]HTJ13159.1 DUF4293 domain-containing protein [Dinghuibacter sp.]